MIVASSRFFTTSSSSPPPAPRPGRWIMQIPRAFAVYQDSRSPLSLFFSLARLQPEASPARFTVSRETEERFSSRDRRNKIFEIWLAERRATLVSCSLSRSQVAVHACTCESLVRIKRKPSDFGRLRVWKFRSRKRGAELPLNGCHYVMKWNSLALRVWPICIGIITRKQRWTRRMKR